MAVVDDTLGVLGQVESAQGARRQGLLVRGFPRDDVNGRLSLTAVGDRRYLPPSVWACRDTRTMYSFACQNVDLDKVNFGLTVIT